MSKGGGSKTEYVTQSSSNAPWEPQQQYLKTGFAQAQSLLNSNTPQYYPESTVVSFSPQTEQALRMVENRALTGSPLVQQGKGAVGEAASGQWTSNNPAYGTMQAGMSFTNSAQPYAASNNNNAYSAGVGGLNGLAQTASGAYLNSNPYLQDAIKSAQRPVIDQFKNQVAPAIDGSFAAKGRYGSAAYANARNTAEDTLSRSLAEQATQATMQNYDTERARQTAAQNALVGNSLAAQQALASVSASQEQQRQASANSYSQDWLRGRALQLQAAGMAPDMAKADYNDAAMLAQVGASREAQNQALLQDRVNRWNFEQQKPWDKLGRYMSMISGGYGGSSQQSTPVYSNPTANALSGAMAGAALGSMAGFDPMYGAIGGGLLGLF